MWCSVTLLPLWTTLSIVLQIHTDCLHFLYNIPRNIGQDWTVTSRNHIDYLKYFLENLKCCHKYPNCVRLSPLTACIPRTPKIAPEALHFQRIQGIEKFPYINLWRKICTWNQIKGNKYSDQDKLTYFPWEITANQSRLIPITVDTERIIKRVYKLTVILIFI